MFKQIYFYIFIFKALYLTSTLGYIIIFVLECDIYKQVFTLLNYFNYLYYILWVKTQGLSTTKFKEIKKNL